MKSLGLKRSLGLSHEKGLVYFTGWTTSSTS